MKETIDLLGKILTNILTALYEPFGFSLFLSFLAMFFYLYAYEPIHAGKGWKSAIVTWYQKFKESVFFRKLFFLFFVTSLILFRTLLNRNLCQNVLAPFAGGRLFAGCSPTYIPAIGSGVFPVFHPDDLTPFTSLLTDLYNLASSSDYIRDMRINEKLGALLTLLMEQSWHPESVTVSRKRMELTAVKEYLDEHYTEKLTLDDLTEKFFINKFYLSKIFKETYGTTVNNYLISKRITRAKQLLRFTDMTVDEVGVAVGMGDANYFSRMFRKIEGISPREYRKQW